MAFLKWRSRGRAGDRAHVGEAGPAVCAADDGVRHPQAVTLDRKWETGTAFPRAPLTEALVWTSLHADLADCNLMWQASLHADFSDCSLMWQASVSRRLCDGYGGGRRPEAHGGNRI